MRTLIYFLLAFTMMAGVRANGGPAGVVAYTNGIYSDPGFRPVATAPDENAVSLVGIRPVPKVTIKMADPVPVFSFDASAVTTATKQEQAVGRPAAVAAPLVITAPAPARPAWVEPAYPENAIFPDSNGTIIASKGLSASSDADNPWDIRAIAASSISDHVFYLSGNIISDGPPIAFINGIPVTRGDKIGLFNVAFIRRETVVLERAGSYYVILLRKKVTIRLPST